MSIDYIESWNSPLGNFGIEDYEDGKPDKDHFFPEGYRAGKVMRFKLWHNGCGVAQAATLEEARAKLWDFALEKAQHELRKAQATIAAVDTVIERILNERRWAEERAARANGAAP